MTNSRPVGMRCPSCGWIPAVAFATQAWCGNDDCRILQWNPTKTMDELLDGSSFIDLPDWLSPEWEEG